jgi:hypothetical protein
MFIEGQAHSKTFEVNRGSDTHDASTADGECRDKDGRCSLRAAVEQANALPGFDVIMLAARKYVLTLKESLVITDWLNIYGVSTESTVIDGAGAVGVLGVEPKTSPSEAYLYLQDLTITNGYNQEHIGGGIAISAGGFVTAHRLAVTDSKTKGSPGGGVAVTGEFTCFDCTISGNSTPISGGGGVQHSGGGVFLDGPEAGAWLYGTTISANSATRGGGIAGGGYLECQNCTISGNTANVGGGGLKTMDSRANWWIAWSTITKNKANANINRERLSEPALGGGVFHNAGTLQIGKTIIADNSDGRDRFDRERFSPDCATTSAFGNMGPPYPIDRAINSHGDNTYGDLGYVCTATSASDGGDVSRFDRWGSAGDPIPIGLEALGDNGGPVQTHKLKPGSPAIDDNNSGNPWSFWLFDCPAVDAAKQSRPVGAACDSGSYEAR